MKPRSNPTAAVVEVCCSVALLILALLMLENSAVVLVSQQGAVVTGAQRVIGILSTLVAVLPALLFVRYAYEKIVAGLRKAAALLKRIMKCCSRRCKNSERDPLLIAQPHLTSAGHS